MHLKYGHWQLYEACTQKIRKFIFIFMFCMNISCYYNYMPDNTYPKILNRILFRILWDSRVPKFVISMLPLNANLNFSTWSRLKCNVFCNI